MFTRASLYRCICLTVCSWFSAVDRPAAQADDLLSLEQARSSLKEVVAAYRSRVGFEGAYLWRYSADLRFQEGEGVANRTSGWTQPPGTPSVGEAYLKAWRLSGETVCLEAARECAQALIRSQLRSGGWSSHFDLGPDGSRKYAYRRSEGTERLNNYTTFDDNKTQSALTLLMHVDEALKFEDSEVHEAVEYGLQHILAAQSPNGAWPQQYRDADEGITDPDQRARYPETWPREYPRADYRGYFTLNDNNMSVIITMLLEAERIYGRDDCRSAALRTGDFFLKAQMPEPQPGWAQQYNARMEPAWARKFEPPAITGGESQAVMRSLVELFRATGERRFVDVLPRAIEYYRSSLLPDGRLARFYELRTNRPLYLTREYRLTYRDDDLPTHYSFQVGSGLDAIEQDLLDALNTPPDQLRPVFKPVRPLSRTDALAARATAVIRQLDSRGLWVDAGHLRSRPNVEEVIEMKTLIRKLPILAAAAGAE